MLRMTKQRRWRDGQAKKKENTGSASAWQVGQGWTSSLLVAGTEVTRLSTGAVLLVIP